VLGTARTGLLEINDVASKNKLKNDVIFFASAINFQLEKNMFKNDLLK